eukprot:TRINITY_DN1772_c0_g1_i4.p1 TRINITY_DN1772_c0_g1~~TRINITY_DN1772_c0_g1_i4.p1  ORF type:complete len:320 (+),score=59.43 TRINITY_DN1772_c0_g1_i4:210-1169(+)
MSSPRSHLEVAIPPVSTPLLSAWFKTTAAREKICRLLQNATRMLAFYSRDKASAASLLALGASASATRKVLRFWNPVDNFTSAYKELCTGKGPLLPRALAAAGSVSCGMTFVMDHFAYPISIGMSKKGPNTPDYLWWSDFFWFWDAFCGLLHTLHKLAAHKLRQASSMTVEDATKSALDLYQEADKNKDGSLTKTEIKNFIKLTPSLRQIFDVNNGWAAVWKSLDTDSDSVFSGAEWSAAYVRGLEAQGLIAKPTTDSDRLYEVNIYVDLFRNLLDIPCALQCMRLFGWDAPAGLGRVYGYGVFTSLCGIWQSYNKVCR